MKPNIVRKMRYWAIECAEKHKVRIWLHLLTLIKERIWSHLLTLTNRNRSPRTLKHCEIEIVYPNQLLGQLPRVAHKWFCIFEL